MQVGVRIHPAKANRQILLIQVRKRRAAKPLIHTGNLNILLPMVTSLDEVDEARRLIERAWT